jgi:hypothetical protein
VLDLTRCDPEQLRLVDAVVTDLLARSTQLSGEDVMIVGARCRDLLQRALGYRFDLRVTSDIDLGLAISNWSAYEELTTNLHRVGDTGIRYVIASVPADLMPFGRVEDPPGTVRPAVRRETMSVWGFTEVFRSAPPLLLPGGSAVRIPTAAGYAALKLAAWLDRSATTSTRTRPISRLFCRGTRNQPMCTPVSTTLAMARTFSYRRTWTTRRRQPASSAKTSQTSSVAPWWVSWSNDGRGLEEIICTTR